MKGTMRAAVFEAVRKITVKEVPIPQISADEMLIKVEYTGICGTDWSHGLLTVWNPLLNRYNK